MNLIDCARKMIKLFSTVFAVAVSFVTLTAHAQSTPGNAKAGEAINAMCIGCHGIKGYQASFPEVYKVPMISGQNAKYIEAALNAYKKGERRHPTMRSISQTLTEQNMADLAAYYAASGVVEGAAAPAKAAEGSAKAMELVAKGACASCHGENDKRIRLQDLPNLTKNPGDGVGVAAWPAYRVSNGQMWGMQQRLNDCYRQQRFPYPGFGSDATIALGVYLGVNSQGSASVAPAIKR